MTAMGPPKQLLAESSDADLVAFLSGGEARPRGGSRVVSVRSNATAVGAFVLGAIGDRHRHRRGVRQRRCCSRTSSATSSSSRARWKGSAVGAPVKYRGVQIGQVVVDQALFEHRSASVDIPVVIELTRGRGRRASRTARKTLEHPDRAGAARAAGAGQPDHRPALSSSSTSFPGTPIREVAERHRLSSDPFGAFAAVRPAADA